jgi:hypothetical protein
MDTRQMAAMAEARAGWMIYVWLWSWMPMMRVRSLMW